MPDTNLYIGRVQIDGGSERPVGSTLFGICETAAATAAKTIANNSSIGQYFKTPMLGITVHIQFTHGNSATSSLTLKLGDADAKPISNPGGSCIWEENAVIAFTYDGTNWVVNDSNPLVSNGYDSTSTAPISGQGVAAAIAGLSLGEAAQVGIAQSITEGQGGNATTHTDVPTTKAVADYVTAKTSGITTAMHFKGITTTTMSDGRTTAAVVIGGNSYTPEAGDVVLTDDSHQEYVWVETNETTHAGYWELLGDEGSYLLASAVEETSVLNGVTLTAGTTPPVVTLDASATTVLTGISNSTGNGAARAASAEVDGGVLKITTGILQTFSSGSVQGVASITAGTAPSLSPSTINVLKNKIANSGT